MKFFFLPVSVKDHSEIMWQIKPVENEVVKTVEIVEEVPGAKILERTWIQPYSKSRAYRFESFLNGVLISYGQSLQEVRDSLFVQ